MTTPPPRQAFRHQVHEQALDTAEAMLVDKGWDQVRFGDVAVAVGISRPTLYAAFGNKDGLATALVQRETDRFLTGISAALDAHAADPGRAVAEAVAYTLQQADRSPVLHGILTQSESLLPLLTTRSAPILTTATEVLSAWFAEHVPSLSAEVAAEGIDALVRLVVSHLVLPATDPELTPDRLARVAIRYLELS